jgi:type III restriction enzyme
VCASSAVEPEIFAEVAADYQSVMSAAALLAAQIDQELDAFVAREADPSSAWGKWSIAVDAFKQAYLDATQRSSAHKERVVELEQINARLNQHLTETARIQEQLSGLQGVEAQYAAERASWIAHREEYDRLMDRQCQVLTQNSAGTIRATIRRFSNTNGFVERLREFLSGSNVRREKLENIGAAITTATDPVATWQAVLHDLEMLADFKPDEEGAGQRPNTAILVRAGLSVSDLDKIAARLSSADWLELSLV